MSNCVSHLRNECDDILLHYLDQSLKLLTTEQKATLAIVGLYLVTQPKQLNLNVDCDSDKLQVAVDFLRQLSVSGKLAVTRAITEELAVLEQLLEVRI